ncbi:extracellular solute-binding protein [Aliiglaciecola sp. CAU 1673]|uniref:sugar ABC transporter substrate-binding protein n=1 Tax=Aliiglaciecola sp. CAU 1673 TaxID=3032595 RepID=UPI0023D9C2C8|nr:extracellular solute-binding protein [Aliiglaciecola sp. CAU 1673]MDF2178247.1 extracellular solute-binding protein [Aliiglaciecola sp. CAU 1673]
MHRQLVRLFILVCVLAQGTAFAASASELSKKSISIAFGHEDKHFAELIDSVAKSIGISVKLRIYDSAQLKVELLQYAARQQLPDAVIVPADFIGLQSLSYSTVPDDWISAKTEERYLPLVTLDGQKKGIPILGGNHLLLYYNRAQISSPVQDWSELLAQKEQTEEEKELIAWSFNVMYWFLPFLGAFDGLPVRGDEILLDSVAMQKALTFYWSLAERGLVSATCNYQCATDKFVQAKIPYLISGMWAYGQLKDKMGEELSVATLPKVEGKSMVPYFAAHVLAFPDNSLESDKRSALKLLSEKMQSQAFQEKLWSTFKALPVNRDVIKNLEQSSEKDVQAILAQLQSSAPMPSDYRMAVIWEAMSKGFNRYGSHIYSAQQASRYMQHMTEQTLENFQQGSLQP